MRFPPKKKEHKNTNWFVSNLDQQNGEYPQQINATLRRRFCAVRMAKAEAAQAFGFRLPESWALGKRRRGNPGLWYLEKKHVTICCVLDCYH